jgi:hypothetical protein
VFTIIATSFLSIFVTFPALAQQVNGAIAGRVVNERDEVIPGAVVTAESAEISIKRSTTTNEEGYFTIPNLPAGAYKVTVKATGFSDVMQENIKLDVGGNFTITARMRVGGAIEMINVTGDSYQTVNRETANIETLISGEQVTELALNGATGLNCSTLLQARARSTTIRNRVLT